MFLKIFDRLLDAVSVVLTIILAFLVFVVVAFFTYVLSEGSVTATLVVGGLAVFLTLATVWFFDKVLGELFDGIFSLLSGRRDDRD